MEQAINERIKIFRKSKGLTQQDIANVLLITQSAYGLIETGKTKVGIDHLTKLQDVYKLNLSWLMSGEGEMFSDVVQQEEVSALKELSIKLDRLITIMLTSASKESEYLEVIRNLSKQWVSENALSVVLQKVA
jgi:transcriptional regulator with XRE-family HTH domain